MFPASAETGRKEDNLSIALLGNRVYSDQTLVEYLIEFLLVFCSAKSADGCGKTRFHTREQCDCEKLVYYVEPRTALRRFIFYDHSKQESRSEIDTLANKAHWQYLRQTARNGEDDVNIIHDLLHSYVIITRNRGWYAQALLPVAPELLLTDLQGIKRRQKARWELYDPKVDDGFDMDKHNFLARGGQVLYLHLLEGLLKADAEGRDDRSAIERLLVNMLNRAGGKVGAIANYVEREWEVHRDSAFKPKTFNMGYIQDGFALRSDRFVQEIRSFLSCDIHPIARIELLSHGLVLSLLRAMHVLAYHRISPDGGEPLWVLDMSRLGGTSNIAKLASASYSAAYDTFMSAMSAIYDQRSDAVDDKFEAIQKGKQHSADVFKSLGKEISLVIPPRGGYERFSLSESLTRYLVLSLVGPHRKITMDTFLDRLYEHFRMVIAPAQYRRAIAEGCWQGSEDMSDYFEYNVLCFQDFLKQCGFLRDLSDATAIVENPYREVTPE